MRGPREDQLHIDPLKAVTQMLDEHRLQFSLNVAIMADGHEAKSKSSYSNFYS